MKHAASFILLIALLISAAGSATSALEWVKVSDLHPTQFSIGWREVKSKMKLIDAMSKEERHAYLETKPIPVVKGPGGQLYMIDHHHLARAIVELDHDHVFVQVVQDWSKENLTLEEFWQRMESRHLVYLYDERDRLRTPDELPEHVEDLKDDPYRALAGELRDEGAFLKSSRPFSEYDWANFFRAKIPARVLEKSWSKAKEIGLRLSRSRDASRLPGYIHPGCRLIFAE